MNYQYAGSGYGYNGGPWNNYDEKYDWSRPSKDSHVRQEIEDIKKELASNNIDLLTKFLRYKNEYQLESQEIVDLALHSDFARSVFDEQSYTIVQQMESECMEANGSLDPSKIILKLCQVVFKGSHKFNPLDQVNKKYRIVEFHLNNRLLYRFKFECANKKIANRATAYESISQLFPGIHMKLVHKAFKEADQFELRAFEHSQSTIKREEHRDQKKSNIYFKLFDCEITKIERIDKTNQMAGFKASGKKKDLDQSFSQKIESKMFSTLANTMLQRYAGRSLNFEVKLNKKIAASNSLEGEGKNEYNVTASDNQAARYFSITVTCQNKMDAKAICGLKFIELHAEEVFKVIWDTIMKDSPYPSSVDNSGFPNSGENTHLFSEGDEYSEFIKPKGPPGLPAIKNSSSEPLEFNDSRMNISIPGSLFKAPLLEGSLQTNSFNKPLGENDLSLSTVKGIDHQRKFSQGLLGHDTYLGLGFSKFPGRDDKQLDCDEEDDNYNPQGEENSLKSNIDRILSENDNMENHLFEEREDSKNTISHKASSALTSKLNSQPAGGYQFFNTKPSLLGKNPGKHETPQGIIGKPAKKAAKDDDSDDQSSDDMSKDSDLKDESSDKKKSQSEDSKNSNETDSISKEDSELKDSIKAIFSDFVNLVFQPEGQYTTDPFYSDIKIAVKNTWQIPSILEHSFSSKINEILEEFDMRIKYYPLKRNPKETQIRFVFEKKEEAAKDFKSLAYSDMTFTSAKMTFEICLNYGFYLIIKKSFPQIDALIQSKTIRSALGLGQGLEPSNTILASSYGGNKSAPIKLQKEEEIMNMSNISHTNSVIYRDAEHQNIFGDEFPVHSKSLAFQGARSEIISDFKALPLNSQSPKTQPPYSITCAEELNISCYVRAVDYFVTHKKILEKDSSAKDEIQSWQKLDKRFDDCFGHKIRNLEPWELIAVYYHNELSVKGSDKNSFEHRIKKKDVFYSNVRKNMMEEDYASVANSLIHTIFKEPMKIDSEGNYSIFSLMNKRLIIVEARVQNMKLRKKLTSMVVLRLLWPEFYVRCTTGDLSNKGS